MDLDHAIIRRAAERLRAGEPVAFPTETVYGLGADALNPAAVARVFALKGRPATNPMIVHVLDESMARPLASEWSDDAHRLALAFWPGPLTIIVPRAAGIPDAVTAGGPTVALRSPDHSVALALLAAFGGPLVGPSANRSGHISPTTAAHVREDSPNLLILDGGPCRTGIESTVIALSPRPRILRPGILTAGVLGQALGRPVEYAAASEPGPAQSPGLHPHHYAPVAPALLFHPAQLPTLLALHQPVTILARSAFNIPAPHRLIRLPAAAAAYATALYAALREADATSPALIAIEQPPAESAEPELWLAISDRLRRATTQA